MFQICWGARIIAWQIINIFNNLKRGKVIHHCNILIEIPSLSIVLYAAVCLLNWSKEKLGWNVLWGYKTPSSVYTDLYCNEYYILSTFNSWEIETTFLGLIEACMYYQTEQIGNILIITLNCFTSADSSGTGSLQAMAFSQILSTPCRKKSAY